MEPLFQFLLYAQSFLPDQRSRRHKRRQAHRPPPRMQLSFRLSYASNWFLFRMTRCLGNHWWPCHDREHNRNRFRQRACNRKDDSPVQHSSNLTDEFSPQYDCVIRRSCGSDATPARRAIFIRSQPRGRVLLVGRLGFKKGRGEHFQRHLRCRKFDRRVDTASPVAGEISSYSLRRHEPRRWNLYKPVCLPVG